MAYSVNPIKIIGLNSQGFPLKNRLGKVQEVHKMLENEKPDCCLILETACMQEEEIIVPHDEYIATYLPVNTKDKRLALGNGTALISKKSIFGHLITELNDEKRGVYRVRDLE